MQTQHCKVHYEDYENQMSLKDCFISTCFFQIRSQILTEIYFLGSTGSFKDSVLHTVKQWRK